MFLSTLRQAEKDVYGVKDVSKLRGIVCDFSFPKIEGIQQEFNKQSLWEFLGLTFDIVNDDGEAPDFTFPRLCAAHMMKMEWNRNGQKIIVKLIRNMFISKLRCPERKENNSLTSKCRFKTQKIHELC